MSCGNNLRGALVSIDCKLKQMPTLTVFDPQYMIDRVGSDDR